MIKLVILAIITLSFVGCSTTVTIDTLPDGTKRKTVTTQADGKAILQIFNNR